MANIAIPRIAVTYRALLSCVLCASTDLSKRVVGVAPPFCLDFRDRGRARARGWGCPFDLEEGESNKKDMFLKELGWSGLEMAKTRVCHHG